MTVSRLRVSKTETRDLAERARVDATWLGDGRRWGEVEPWRMSDATFFIVLVAIAAALALAALALR